MNQTEKKSEQPVGQSKLERGLQLLVLAFVWLGLYKTAEGNADERQMAALMTVIFAVAGIDDLMTHYRGRSKDN